MQDFRAPVLIKKVANGEKSHKDLTREDAQWIMTLALEGQLTDVQLGALLAALRLKGETAEELAGFLAAVVTGTERIPTPPGPLVAHCGVTGGKDHAFLASPGAALLASAAGVRVCICSRSGAELGLPTTEIDVFHALGVATCLTPAVAGEALDGAGLCVVEQQQFHPRLARLSGLRKELGMRTVAQSLEKYVFPVQPTAAVAGAFHRGPLQRLAEATAATFGFPLFLLQTRDGTIDPLPARYTPGFQVRDGEISEWQVSPEAAGLAPQDPASLPALDATGTADLTVALLQGALGGPHREMLLYAAGLLLHAGLQRPLDACVAQARDVLASGAGMAVLARLRQMQGTAL